MFDRENFIRIHENLEWIVRADQLRLKIHLGTCEHPEEDYIIHRNFSKPEHILDSYDVIYTTKCSLCGKVLAIEEVPFDEHWDETFGE